MRMLLISLALLGLGNALTGQTPAALPHAEGTPATQPAGSGDGRRAELLPPAIAYLEHTRGGLKAQIGALQRRISESQEEQSRVEAQLELARQQLSDAQAQAQALARRNGAQAELEAQNREFQARIRELELGVQNLTDRKVELEGTLNGLRRELAASRRLTEDFDKIMQCHAALNQENSRLRQEVVALREEQKVQRDAINALNSTLGRPDPAIQDLRQTNERLASEIEHLKASVAARSNTVPTRAPSPGGTRLPVRITLAEKESATFAGLALTLLDDDKKGGAKVRILGVGDMVIRKGETVTLRQPGGRTFRITTLAYDLPGDCASFEICEGD